MPTGGEEFTSLVQGGPTWFEYYVVDLLDTKVTLFGGRVERLASLEDFSTEWSKGCLSFSVSKHIR